MRTVPPSALPSVCARVAASAAWRLTSTVAPVARIGWLKTTGGGPDWAHPPGAAKVANVRANPNGRSFISFSYQAEANGRDRFSSRAIICAFCPALPS